MRRGHKSDECRVKLVPSASKKPTAPELSTENGVLPAPDVPTGQSDLISPTTAENSDPPTQSDPIEEANNNLMWSHALAPSQNVASTSAAGLSIRTMPEKRGRQENDPDSCDISGLEQRENDDEEGTFTPVMGKKKKKVTQGDGARRGNCPSYCHCYRCDNDL
jgi:hypothetical protein